MRLVTGLMVCALILTPALSLERSSRETSDQKNLMACREFAQSVSRKTSNAGIFQAYKEFVKCFDYKYHGSKTAAPSEALPLIPATVAQQGKKIVIQIYTFTVRLDERGRVSRCISGKNYLVRNALVGLFTEQILSINAVIQKPRNQPGFFLKITGTSKEAKTPNGRVLKEEYDYKSPRPIKIENVGYLDELGLEIINPMLDKTCEPDDKKREIEIYTIWTYFSN